MKIKELREEKGVSQSKLSETSGVNLRTIQMYEINGRSIDGARLSTLCDLALALDCKVIDILESEALIAKFSKCI